jgi:hypothetical protein
VVDNVQPGHIRQGDIGSNGIEAVATDGLEGGLSAADDGDLAGVLTEDELNQPAKRRVVFNDEDTERPTTFPPDERFHPPHCRLLEARA